MLSNNRTCGSTWGDPCDNLVTQYGWYDSCGWSMPVSRCDKCMETFGQSVLESQPLTEAGGPPSAEQVKYFADKYGTESHGRKVFGFEY